jgi:hypothetical protein
LKFSTPTVAVSGLLRTVNPIDNPLNHETTALAVTNVVDFENNDNLWFYTDFSVGYDPCSCMLNGALEVVYDLVNEENIKMVSNTLGVEFDLVDANGAMTTDLNFLASTQYDGATGFGQAGSQLYAKMQDLTSKYRLDLRKVQEKNVLIEANNAEIEKKLAIIDAIGVVLKIGTALIPGGAAAEEVIQAAEEAASAEVASQVITATAAGISVQNFMARISGLPQSHPDVVDEVDEEGGIHIDTKKLFEKGSEYLGMGLDYYAESLKKGIQEEIPKPKSPIASMQTTTYAGSITEWDTYGAIKLWNPGSYPVGTGGAQLSQSIFPIYNELLGLFAILKDPSLVRNEEHYTQYVSIDENVIISNGQTPMANIFTVDLNTKHKASLSLADANGLVYCFNPAAGIDFTNPEFEIKAALVVNGSYSNEVSQTIGGFPLIISTNPTDTYSANNLLLSPSFANGEIKSGKFQFESPFMPLANFTSMVESYELNLRSTWTLGTGLNTNFPLATLEQIQQVVTSSFFPDYDLQLNYQIKVLVRMPFVQPGFGNNQDNLTTQVFTYNVPIDAITNVSSPMSSFSLTNNPNGNGPSITENLSFGLKMWDSSDNLQYGSMGQTIKPYAWNNIYITGNQSTNSTISNVVMTAQNEIIVSGDAIIFEDITLTTDAFVAFTSIPTNPINNSFLEVYCQGGQNDYHANVPRNAVVSSNNFANVNYQKKIQEKVQFSIYPNPTTETLNLSLLNFSGQVQFEIYNAIGNKLQSFSKTVDNGIRMNYVTYSAADLPNGTYTIVARMADGTSVTEQFVVLK